MKRFTRLFIELDQTNRTNVKVEAMVRYLNEAPDEDKMWMMALLSGKRPRRSVKTSLLKIWAAELAGIPDWLFEESYHVVGDLSETIALVFPPTKSPGNKSLSEWMEFLIALKDLDEEKQKEQVINAWLEMDTQQRFVFNKLSSGGFRMGVSQKLMVRALSKYTELEESTLAHRLMGDWDPVKYQFQDLIYTFDPAENHSKPYPFYLAYALDQEPQELGTPSDWQAEYKWDGIRGQLLKRAGAVYIWSRGEELVTDKFPELESLKDCLPDGVAIDGEILPFKDDRILPFSVLQTRIGRKNLSKKILEQAPIVFRAYDLLEWDSIDIRDKPLSKRREYLEKLFREIPENGSFQLSKKITFSSWNQLAEIREKAREHQSEGLMLKKLDASYRVGRKRGDWWKWKVDPLTIDAVMIYAMRGHGRRANLYTDYTFAVWNGESLVPFTKAYSGLTDQEIREVDRFVKKNTLERFGPVRSVKPELVFEIAFEGIQASTRHKSGIALRFPRIHRWRKDKPSSEANTLDDLHEILNQFV
jgi:DNA ligase-1